MGFLKKMKDIFYDEEIIEVPVKEEKTTKKLEIEESPKIEFIKDEEFSNEKRLERSMNDYSERELFKPEKTFDFPVIDDEEEMPKTRSKTNILEIQKELERSARENRETRNYNFESSKKEELKRPSTFRPSPVISPIYGILDKNYTKDGIIEKTEEKKERSYKTEGPTNYDYVRAKAYGSLEDELENTLTRINDKSIKTEIEEIEKEIDSLPKPSKNIEALLDEIEGNKNSSIGDLEEKAKDKMLMEEEKEDYFDRYYDDDEKEEKNNNIDNTLEHDLFNLIDSMYEDKED